MSASSDRSAGLSVMTSILVRYLASMCAKTPEACAWKYNDEEMKLHDTWMKHRHKLFAHSDSKRFPLLKGGNMLIKMIPRRAKSVRYPLPTTRRTSPEAYCEVLNVVVCVFA
jgi:hypothetical protein